MCIYDWNIDHRWWPKDNLLIGANIKKNKTWVRLSLTWAGPWACQILLSMLVDEKTYVGLMPRLRQRTWLKSNKRFFKLLSLTTRLHPPTKIPVLNDPLSQVQSCKHEVIQVAQFHAACCKKWCTCILLSP